MTPSEHINVLFTLLGQSENSDHVKSAFTNLNVPQPLPRVDKDTNDLLLEDVTPYLNLGFSSYDELERTHTDDRFIEGELIFAELSLKNHKELKDVLLPLGLRFDVDLDYAIKTLGDFSDKCEFENTYVWEQDGYNALFSFDEDNKNMYAAHYLLLPVDD